MVPYKLHDYDSEDEICDLARKHYADLFRSRSIYFDFEPRLRTEAEIGSKPDSSVLIVSSHPGGAKTDKALFATNNTQKFKANCSNLVVP